METKPENILIYATSNRRHLIKETWSDRDDVKNENGMHKSDTMEEKLSLVNRFGVTISYSKPTQKEYFNIVIQLARKEGITMPDEELQKEANKWELSHGGISRQVVFVYNASTLPCLEHLLPTVRIIPMCPVGILFQEDGIVITLDDSHNQAPPSDLQFLKTCLQCRGQTVCRGYFSVPAVQFPGPFLFGSTGWQS